MKKAAQRRGGFSRVETLILGGVGALCCAFLWPALAQNAAPEGGAGDGKPLTDEQMSNQCMSNLKQLSLGFLQYVQDYDERYPMYTVRAPQEGDGGRTPVGWADSIYPYIQNYKLLQCLAEKHVSSMTRVKEGPVEDMIRDAAQLSGYTDYWYNANLHQIDAASIESPARTLLMGDGDGGTINSNARYTLNSLPASWVKNPQSPAYRHLGSAVAAYAFADGHVKLLPPTKVTSKPPGKLKEEEATFEEGVPTPNADFGVPAAAPPLAR